MEQDNMKVQEEDFASMLEESFQENQKNSVCDGVIVAIEGDSVLIDVGEKLEGKINISEITDKNGEPLFKVGDKLPIVIKSFRSERPIISHKSAIKAKHIQDFIEKYENDYEELVIDGKIVSGNRNGFIVAVDEAEFFLPNSQIRRDNNLVGKILKFKILKIDKEKNSVIVSRRKFLKDESKKVKDVVKAILKDDVIVDGTIKKITSYGMFVDVGGIDGLVHYNEISYKGPVNPAKLYKEGDVITVKAIDYDTKKKHLSLSVKQATPDPWEEIKEELEVGDVIKVTVSNIESYGAFVDLGNDIEGFLHISEISWDKDLKHPQSLLKVGEEVDVEVIELDFKNRRLRVSYKRLQPKPFEEFTSKYKEGDAVKGIVTTLTDFGAFIKIDKVEGLLHNENATWDKNLKCKDFLKDGDEIDVKITNIDKENEKISLNKKDLEESPAESFAKNNKIGDLVKGKIKNIKDFGVFIELENGIDALIRKEDLYPVKVEDLEVNQDIEAVISLIDSKTNKVRLSVKRLAKKREKDTLKEINSDSISLGDTLGEALKEQIK
jgi:small subunit ribosomal protein S1